MKTAVSIPDDIFERAERLASQGRRSRSEVYAAALGEYLARHAQDEVTETMNRVCGKVRKVFPGQTEIGLLEDEMQRLLKDAA